MGGRGEVLYSMVHYYSRESSLYTIYWTADFVFTYNYYKLFVFHALPVTLSDSCQW